MDGLIRSMGGAIGHLFSGAMSAIGDAIHGVVAQFERFVPGGTLPAAVLGLLLLAVLTWAIVRR